MTTTIKTTEAVTPKNVKFTDPLVDINQPKIKSPIFKSEKNKPPHKVRKKKNLKFKTFAEPQAFFDVNVSDDVTRVASGFMDQLTLLRETVLETMPSAKEKDRFLSNFDKMAATCQKVNDTDLRAEITAIVAQLKLDARNSMSSARETGQDILWVSLFGASVLYYAWKPSTKRMVTVGVTLVTLFMFSNLSKNTKMIISIVTCLGAAGLTFGSDNTETFATPEMEFKSLEAIIASITTMFACYVSFESGKNVPVELFKNLGTSGRVKSTLSEAAKIVFDVFENIYNWIKDALFDSPRTRFFTTNISEIEEYCKRADEIFELERTGKFYRVPANYDRLCAAVTAGNSLLYKLPRDASVFNASTILSKSVESITKIKVSFQESHPNITGARQEAVGILLKGGPGVGKSVTMEHMNYAILSQILSDVDFEAFKLNPYTFIFNRQFENSYWDGYDAQKIICMFDDFGQARDVAGNPDCEAMNIIRAGTQMPMELHCAAMNLKGNLNFQSKFIVATTNLDDIHFESVINDEAVLRRFDIQVVVVPKQEYCTKTTKGLGYFERRLDPAKLPKVNVSDQETRYKPGVHKFSNLLPSCQDFHIIGRNGKISASPLNFDQFVALIMDKYRDKRLQHLAAQDNFQKTAAQFRKEIPGEGNQSFLNGWRRKEMDMNNRNFGRKEPGFEESSGARPESGDIIMEVIDDDAPSVYEDSHDEFVEYESQAEAVTPNLFTRELDIPYDEEFARAMAGIDLERRVRKVPQDTLLDSLISGYSKNEQIITKRLLKAYGDMENERARTFRAEIVQGSNTYFADLPKGVAFPVVIAECVRTFGTEFVVACTNDYINRYFSGIGWCSEHWDPPAPKNAYVHDFSELLGNCRDTVLEYSSKLNKNTFIMKLKEALENRPIISSTIGIITIICGIAGVKAFFSRVFGFANPQSMGHSDKMKKTHTKKFYRTSKEAKEAIANPQMGESLDSSGVSLAQSIGVRNVYQIWIETNCGTEEFSMLGYVTMIQGRIGLMPYHFVANMLDCIERNPKFADARVLLKKTAAKRTQEFPFRVRDIINGHETGVLQAQDCVLVAFPRTMQPCVDRVPNFASRKDYERIAVNIPFMMVLSRKGGEAAYYTGNAHANDATLNMKDDNLGNWTIRKSYCYDAFTDKGDCGAPFIVLNPAMTTRKIFGIHVAGDARAGLSYSAAVCQEDLAEDLQLFEKQVDHMPEELFAQAEANNVIFSEGQFNELGLVPIAPSRNFRSEIQPSLLHGSWKQATTKPALLRKRDLPDGSIIDPVANAQKKYCYPAVWFDSEKVEMARNVLYSYLTSCSITYHKRLLTLRESVNGVEEETISHGIAVSTSPGYPMNTSGVLNLKKWLFDAGREGEEFDKRFTVVEEIVDEVESLYKSGKRPVWFFTDCLKDERRPIEKVDAGSTRMFSGCPFVYLILWKKYFGAFNLEYQANNISVGCSVGVNPYSNQWTHLARKLTQFDVVDSCVGAGDYSAFDGSEKPTLHYAILDIINRWYGDSIENQKIREIMWLEVVNSRHIMDGIAYEWSSSLPSGHPFTIVINSLYNHLAFLLCWDKLGLEMSKFYENVYLCVCGDDNIFTVHPKYREVFNEITICVPMSELGLTYTTETKGTAVLPFRRLEDVEFLKRSFRFEKIENRWMAPLRLSVVLEIPFWTKRGGQKFSIAASNTIEALRELSLHDSAVYAQWEPKIVKFFRARYPRLVTTSLEMTYRERQVETCDLVAIY